MEIVEAKENCSDELEVHKDKSIVSTFEISCFY